MAIPDYSNAVFAIDGTDSDNRVNLVDELALIPTESPPYTGTGPPDYNASGWWDFNKDAPYANGRAFYTGDDTPLGNNFVDYMQIQIRLKIATGTTSFMRTVIADTYNGFSNDGIKLETWLWDGSKFGLALWGGDDRVSNQHDPVHQLTPGTWYDIKVINSENTTEFFIDGVGDGGQAQTLNFTGALNSPLVVGNQNNLPSDALQWLGSVQWAVVHAEVPVVPDPPAPATRGKASLPVFVYQAIAARNNQSQNPPGQQNPRNQQNQTESDPFEDFFIKPRKHKRREFF